MALEQQRLTPVERANLVAYIDGELNEAESRAIATKLTLSPTARREVEALERTWELLDHLPRPKASDELIDRTLTEVRLDAERGARVESIVKSSAARLVRVATWVAVSALVFFGGYAATQWVWPNPTARLARELPIAEHLDEYRDVGSFQFLQELVKASPSFDD
jgi:anti-sigma factor RsiW